MSLGLELLQACMHKREDKRSSMTLISSTKSSRKGDLVLVYTLKQHLSKLKKRGMGPFVIHELSASGAVQLATLDGEPMANWISGCRIKKYHEPLTQEILQRLHNAKERKQKEAK